MTFKEWLKLHETGTGTNAIASFARPIFSSPQRRGSYKDLMLGGRPVKDQNGTKQS